MLLASLILGVALATPRQANSPLPDADDVKDIPAKAFFVKGDAMKRYAVIGDATDAANKKLCIVMPGGDGSIDFLPFVKRILKYGLGSGWIIAEPVAPAWTTDSNRVVWPSVGVPYKPAKFTMEEFLDGMLDELKDHLKSKVEGVYMLGWSSSGPSIYSYAAHGKHPITGAYVAMSVFNAPFFGDAKQLTVKRFYLLHSPQDFIQMSNPNAAKAALEKLGVPVKLDTYEGGHGWHGDVYGEIGVGFRFLQAKGN